MCCAPSAGNFVFEDGTPVRWFGLNVVDNRVFNMYAPETAKTVARKMAALGINIVRIHHMTAGWQNAAPFFKDRAESTLEFNDRALELLDRFTAALKEEGIYVTCELPDSSLEPALSEIPNGTREGFDLKLLMLFDPEVQAYVKKYVRAFFTRPNRYTGRSLFEDPQFVMLGVVNEVAYNYHPKGLAGLNPYYTGKLRPKFPGVSETQPAAGTGTRPLAERRCFREVLERNDGGGIPHVARLRPFARLPGRHQRFERRGELLPYAAVAGRGFHGRPPLLGLRALVGGQCPHSFRRPLEPGC